MSGLDGRVVGMNDMQLPFDEPSGNRMVCPTCGRRMGKIDNGTPGSKAGAEGRTPAIRPEGIKHRLLRAFASPHFSVSGLTDAEAADETPNHGAAPWMRCSDLRSAGLIRPDNPARMRVNPHTNTPQQVNHITPAGVSALATLNDGRTWKPVDYEE